MIGLVIVSHSARLAEGVCELAAEMAQGRVRLAAAGGTGDPDHPIGTDAFRVLEAIENVYSEDGVLVFTDLGSAVLSAETALEMLDEARRARVHLRDAPLVEGAVAAAAQAAAGADLAELIGERTPVETRGRERLVTVPNALGLHARPAVHIVRLVRGRQAHVSIENLTRPAGPVDAGTITGVLALDARRGDALRLRSEDAAALEQLAAFIEAGCGDTEAPVARPAAAAGDALAGLPASAGIAVGPLVRLRPAAMTATDATVEDPEAEWQRLLAAMRGAQEESRALAARAGADEAGIFDAQALFLEDSQVAEAAARLVLGERRNAAFAWRETMAEFAGRLGRLDVADVAARVWRRLAGAAPAGLTEPAIVAAHDLTPSEVQALDPTRALGLCLEGGAANAHSVILARAMGIPAVAGLGPALSSVPEGATVALDGERGLVWVTPDAERLRELESRRRQWLDARVAGLAERHRPAHTRDGRRIHVVANISSVAEAAEAVERGAEGVGVLRTEFLFLNRTAAPDEEEQFAAYRAIAAALGGRPLVIRTLDIGGDKSLPYIETRQEANPFLGWRGIRLTLGRPELLRTQARAIVRAGGQILLPMVSSLDELRDASAIIGAKAGIMIEVPSAAAIAGRLAREAAFFSIGTNDLIQYVMAADRTNPRVARLADPFQPAVLRVLREVIAAGREAGIPVALCGELAADALATPLLLGLGLDEFSVSAPLIPELKRTIARWSVPEAEAIAREALEMDSSRAVRELLSKS